MKFTFTRVFFYVSVLGILTSCLDSNTATTEVSSDGAFSSLSFSSSSLDISKVNFALQSYTVDGLQVIQNQDSIKYQTDIDSVITTFKFNSTAGASYKYDGKSDSTWLINGSDTIDFTRRFTLRNIATDTKTIKSYKFITNLHKVNPMLTKWDTLITNNLNLDGKLYSHKLIYAGTKVWYFSNDSTSAWVQSSQDGISWSNRVTLSNFPTKSSLHNMQYFNGSFYATDGSYTIYSSTDGTNWIKATSPDYKFCSLVYSYDSKLWAIVMNNSNEYRFATLATTPGSAWVVRGIIPTGFPVSDFASISFKSRNNIPKGLVIGGKSANNTELKSIWATDDGTYWSLFNKDNPSLDTLTIGSTLIQYNKKLFILGFRNTSLKPAGNDSIEWRQSVDEGYSWQVPDTLTRLRFINYQKKKLYPYTDTIASYRNYTASKYPAIVVMNPVAFDSISTDEGGRIDRLKANNILVIGGKKFDGTRTKEVWKGKLNKLNFLRQTVK